MEYRVFILNLSHFINTFLRNIQLLNIGLCQKHFDMIVFFFFFFFLEFIYLHLKGTVDNDLLKVGKYSQHC